MSPIGMHNNVFIWIKKWIHIFLLIGWLIWQWYNEVADEEVVIELQIKRWRQEEIISSFPNVEEMGFQGQ